MCYMLIHMCLFIFLVENDGYENHHEENDAILGKQLAISFYG